MRTKKIISLILAVITVFTLSSTAFAADIESIEKDIAFLSEHEDIMVYYWRELVLPSRKEKLEEIKANPEPSQEEIDALAERVSELKRNPENCLAGNHQWYGITNDSTDETDTDNDDGAYICFYTHTDVWYCEYCTTETITSHNIRQIKHKDWNVDGICDNCSEDMPYCDHICHSKNIFIQKILMPIVRFIRDFFDIEKFCQCGTYHHASGSY